MLPRLASFNSCEQFVSPSDRLNVKVIGVNAETGMIAASVKALHPDPWTSDELATGVKFRGRVVRYVEKADRCMD